MFPILFFSLGIAAGVCLILAGCGINPGLAGGAGMGSPSAIIGIVLGELMERIR